MSKTPGSPYRGYRWSVWEADIMLRWLVNAKLHRAGYRGQNLGLFLEQSFKENA